jgi:hypothetical protein
MMSCPKCGSNNIQIVTDMKVKGFSAGKGCCGWLIFGPIGVLCGLCGMGKGRAEHLRMCANCGHKFR